MKAYDSLDVLFIGNSYTYSGIDTEILDSVGVKTFNLGLATAGPLFYDVAVKSYLNSSNVNPKVLCVLSSPTSFSSKSDNFSAYPIHRYLGTPISNESIAVKYGYADYSEMFMNSFKKGVRNLARILLRKMHRSCDCACYIRSYHDGFVPSNTVNTVANVRRTKRNYVGLSREVFDRSKADAFLRFCQYMKEKGVSVVLYTIPTNRLESYYSADFINDYNTFVSSLAKSYPLVRTNLPVDDRYFRNIDHINSQGAIIVTKQIIEGLKLINS